MYTPLYVKTNNSLLQSIIKIDDLIKYAKENNIISLSITDNNMYGVMEFYNKCLANNIKPIVGLEITIENKKIILYCLNYDGYKNLIKLSTLASKQELNLEDLIFYAKHLICILPYESKSFYNELNKVFIYIYMGYKNDAEKNEIGVKKVFLNETLYLESKDQEYIKYLWAIKEGKNIDEITQIFNDNGIRKKETIADLENNYKIAEICDLEIIKEDLLPIYETPNNTSAYEYLKELCLEGLKKIFGKRVKKEYIERLKYELKVIKDMGFCDYFLIVWDYVKYAKDNNILVGPGRGSAPGSLVAYCLNITTVDPIKYNLLFERFLNPERITMPDIDIDFEYQERGRVVDYCIKKYGIDRVAYIITFGTLGAKQVIRDVGKVLEINISSIDKLAKKLDSRLNLIDNYQTNSDLKRYLNLDENLMKLYKIAMKLEGLKRHTSIHAAGIVMAKTNLDNVIPLDCSHEKFYTTAYSMEYLENLGLLKMDFLGLRNLTLIKDILKDLKIYENIELDFDEIPLDDTKAINIFTTVNTIGIFQFESPGMMNFLRKFKPNTFEDIIAAIALFRPGPMQMIDNYIKRKHGLEKITFLAPSLEPILSSTYGIIIYQEQIMQIARDIAGYTYAESDLLRRAMSKKQESIMLKEKQRFIDGCIKNGYNNDLANEIYELVLRFASYGFNRAHSVSYALISYKMAFLKAHYPKYFIKNLLSMVINSELKTKEYVYEAKMNNIEILKPDINLSYNYYVVESDGIRYPLNIIKNVGENASKLILNERKNGRFKDVFDFIKRVYGKAVTKKTIESLIYADCFSSFGLNKKTLIENLNVIINYGELLVDIDDSLALKPEIIKHNEYSKKELISQELEIFGFHLSNHPVTEYKLKTTNIINISDYSNYFDKTINTILYVEKIRTIETKNNEIMAFMTCSDEYNTIDVVLFPKIYQEYYFVEPADVILISAKVEKRFDKLQLIVNKLKKIN